MDSIVITQGEPINISINQTKENYNLNFEGEVVKIDANYPQALEAARIATEKAEEATQIVDGFDEHASDKIAEYNANASEKLSEFNTNAANKKSDFNNNALAKTSAYNDNADNHLSEYNSNADNKLEAYNNNDGAKTSAYNSNASEKVSAYNANDIAKTQAYNNNATAKTADFNTNASDKTSDFNTNYSIKKALIDAKATESANSADLAKQWAIGEPSEPAGNSSKYWAGQAQAELSGITSRVSTIEGKIPSSAGSSNKLTDKSYVDMQDNNLQSQIDAIVASSDVFDIVGTYAELQAYDISSVPVNDIIKVLVDSTHANAATYYRCIETAGVKSWSYIGSEGASYTKAETNTLLNTKQNTLVSGTNIKTVNGSSILGSGNLTTSAQWGGVTGTLSNQTDLQNALNAKQGTLTFDNTPTSGSTNPATSGGIYTALSVKANDSDVVKLTGNQTIAGTKTFSDFLFARNFNLIKENSATEGGQIGFMSADNEVNAGKNMFLDRFDGKFRFVGQDSNSVTRVPLEIDIQNNKAYSITPATSDNSTEIATTAYVVNVLKAIYPVGAVYIGTTSTCPLAAFFGTWTLESTGIVTSVNTNVPVKGNGTALGLTNGSINAGLVMEGTLNGRANAYGVNVGGNINIGNQFTNGNAVGVTTDSSKSGIVGTVTRSTLAVNIFRRTA